MVFEDKKLSYLEVNEKSNQLARHIREEYKSKTNTELTPDTLIALYLDRGFEMVVGILAVLKSGGLMYQWILVIQRKDRFLTR